MKLRHLFVSILAAAGLLMTSCQEKEKDLGLPEIKITQNELALDQNVNSVNLNVYATRNWTVSTAADWISVNPSKGSAYQETAVTVTVLENAGYNRVGTVKFDIGYDSKTLTINQTGAQGEKSEGSGTMTDPYTVAGVLAFIQTLGTETSENAVYIKGKIAAITLTYEASGTYGNARFTMVDEGSTEAFTAYNVLYLGNKKWSAGQTDIKEGDEVIVCSKVFNYGGKTPETATGGYLYSLNGETAGGGSGDEAKGTGTLDDPYNPAGAAAAVASLTWTSTTEYQTTDEVYVKGKISKIADKGTYTDGGTYGNATFYITETGESTGTEFYVYRILYLGNKKYESGQTDIKVGDEVIIYGKLMNYRGNTPETASGAYLYSLNGVTENTGGGGGGTDETYFTETFETSQGNFTIDNKTMPTELTYVWKHDATNKYMKASAFANSTNYATESWLISPEIDLTSAPTAFLSFDHVMRYFGTANQDGTLKVTIDNGANWADVTIPTYPDGSSWTFVSSGEISLASYVGKKIKLAFIYKSSTDAAATWEIKNVKVYKTSTAGGGDQGGGGGTVTGITLSFPDENNANNQVSAYTATWSAKIGSNSWTIANFNNNKWGNNWNYIRGGRKNEASIATIATDQAFASAIKKVVVTLSKVADASKINSAKLIVASDSGFTQNVQEVVATITTTGDVTYTVTTPTANCFYKLVYDMSGYSANGIIEITKVVYAE